ncbi:hypothetical protein H0H92_008825 [Tricholoma furcatifolium]|nr:hypothetical protein H0H92_008825 [Tricholoma furcatifolium]
MVTGAFKFVLRQLVYHDPESKMDSVSQLGFDAFQKEEMYRVNEVSYWVASIVQFNNDCIITWRAWVLCQDRRWLTALPVFLLFCSGATSLTFLICVSYYQGYYDYTIGGPTPGDALIYTTGALTLSNNILSTSLIAYQLWTDPTCFRVWRKSWTPGLGDRWSHAQKILLMIIESGAVYIALQLVVAFLFNQDHKLGSASNYVENVAWSGYIHLTAMYATFVLVLINHKRSLSDIECFAATTVCGSNSESTTSGNSDTGGVAV